MAKTISPQEQPEEETEGLAHITCIIVHRGMRQNLDTLGFKRHLALAIPLMNLEKMEECRTAEAALEEALSTEETLRDITLHRAVSAELEAAVEPELMHCLIQEEAAVEALAYRKIGAAASRLAATVDLVLLLSGITVHKRFEPCDRMGE